MKTDNNIDRYLKENLYDFQVTPPEGVWNSIEQDLKKSSRRLVIPLIVKVAAGIVLLISLAAIIWRVSEKDNTPTKTILTEEVDRSDNVIENTEVIKIAAEDESLELAAKSESIESSTEIPLSSGIAEVNIKEEKPAEIIPVDIREEQKENEQVVHPVKIESEIAPSEITKDILTKTETDNIGDAESSEKINKNDLIIQQNLLVLDESSDDSKNKSDSRWSIGGQAGPQYSYRDVSVSPDYQGYQNYDKFEDGMLAFAGGVNVQLQAAKRISIQSGVYYSKIGQEKSSMVYGDQLGINDRGPFEYTENESPEPIVNSTGTFAFSKDLPPPVDQTTSASEASVTEGTVYTEQSFEFVEIPLIFKYFVVDKKLDISINGGLWTNILIGNRAVATDNQDFHVEDKTNDINTLNYSGSLGIGFNYPITSNLLISLDPIFKYYLSPINSNPETEVHPYTFGIMTGINYSF